jgi:hypothetical protein
MAIPRTPEQFEMLAKLAREGKLLTPRNVFGAFPDFPRGPKLHPSGYGCKTINGECVGFPPVGKVKQQ